MKKAALVLIFVMPAAFVVPMAPSAMNVTGSKAYADGEDISGFAVTAADTLTMQDIYRICRFDPRRASLPAP